MPVVPQLETPTVQAEPLPGRPTPHIDTDVSPQDFGSGLAQGLEQVGAAGADHEAELKRQNDQLRVIDANTQLEAGKTAMLYGKQQSDGTRTGGAFSLHGMDAINMPDKILPQYSQLAQQISAGLSPDQQRLFHAHVSQGQNELDTALNRYEYEESNRLSNAIYTNGAKQTITNATVGWRDPAAIDKARDDLQGLVTMQGDREGWNADERAQQLSKLQAEMHFNVVDRQLADGNPQAALSYFKKIRDTSELTGEQSHQLGAQIDAAMAQGKAQNQTALLAQINDVRTAGINGQAIPPSSLPSHGAVLAAFPEDGERRWKDMQSDIAMGADLKGMAALSPSELQAKVESYKPAGVTGAVEGYERYNAVGAAATRILTQRAQDPRQYTIDNSLGSKPLNFQDTQSLTSELRTRLAATPQDSARMGGYVPPLSRTEAQQFSQSLESMPAADRLRTLAALNQGLQNDKGFQTVMRQIMPGSPVTAIVGGQLGQSNPANVPVWYDRQFAPSPTDQTRILAGEALIHPQGTEKTGGKEGSGFPMPPDSKNDGTGTRPFFAEKTGDLFRDRPQLADAYFATFKAAYAQLLSEKGDYSANGDSRLRDQALKMAIGNQVTVGNRSVAAPLGMDPSRFESILDAAVNVQVKKAGQDPDKIRGYQLSEIGGLGSGRYELTQGNAPLANPNGKGTFIVDLRNQYMAGNGAKPAPADATRIAADQTAAPAVAPAAEVAGQPKVGKESSGHEQTFKPPAETGLARGGGRGAKAHPSQGPTAE